MPFDSTLDVASASYSGTSSDHAVYYLSRHAYVCCTQSYWIVLNVLRDKYYCVSDTDVQALSPWLHGLAGNDDRTAVAPPNDTEDPALIESFISNGVVTRDAGAGKPFTAINCEMPTTGLAIPVANRFPIHHFAPVFAACATADCYALTHSLSWTLARIERRRQNREHSSHSFDLAKVASLAATFRHFRPFYPRGYVCLFDSIALLEFLARYRLYPRLVFGVLGDPFQAHCWLQEGPTAINDDPERLCKYSPILAI
jgi:Transglutaminase-like superfamily